jgi:hypothetical protein
MAFLIALTSLVSVLFVFWSSFMYSCLYAILLLLFALPEPLTEVLALDDEAATDLFALPAGFFAI